MHRAATFPLASTVLLWIIGLTSCGGSGGNPIVLPGLTVVTTTLPAAERNGDYQGMLEAAGAGVVHIAGR